MWPEFVVSAALLWSVSACAPAVGGARGESPYSWEVRVQREAQCQAGALEGCTALHLACLDAHSDESCRGLAGVSQSTLAANPSVFDDPLHYVALLCFERDDESACASLSSRGRDSDIVLGVSEQEAEAILDERKEMPAHDSESPAPGSESSDGKLLEELGDQLGGSAFAEGLGSGGFGSLTFIDVLEELCQSGDGDACYSFAYRQGTILNATKDCLGCGDAYDDVRAAMDRAHELFAGACRDDDRVACYKMGLWVDERTYRLRHGDPYPTTGEELSNQNAGFRKACALGLLDGCNASVRNIASFNRRVRSSYMDLFVEELLEDSEKACSLAGDTTSSECSSYLVVLMRYTPLEERVRSLARRASELGLEALYRQLAYWEHDANARRPSE